MSNVGVHAGGRMDLSIIVVNYNTREILRSCLLSIARETHGVAYEIIVVDNASTDGSREMLERDFPATRTIYNQENKGFAAANNVGFALARGKYLLMLNSDTVILDDAIHKTLRFMQDYPEASIVGCKLLNPDQTLQPSVRSFPNLWNLFCEAAFLHLVFPKSKSFGRYHMTYFSYDIICEVDWATGAFLMFERRVLEMIGGLDERFYMFSEEMDFCLRARSAGFRTYFYPGAEIVHIWAGSSKDFSVRIRTMYMSQLAFILKHYKFLKGIAMVLLFSLGCSAAFWSIPFQGLFYGGQASLFSPGVTCLPCLMCKGFSSSEWFGFQAFRNRGQPMFKY
jgi:GT2 family glycosyltransferase